MERQIATVDGTGRIALPATVRAVLGIIPGTQIEVSVVDRHLLLTPVKEDPINAVRSMYGIGTALEEDVKRATED